jgi:hypothetical protein
MKINQQFFSKSWTVGIIGSDWRAVRHGYGFISTRATRLDFKTVNANAKGLNKRDKLEDCTTEHTLEAPTRDVVGKSKFSVTLTVDQIKVLLDFCCDDDARYYANGICITPRYAVCSDALTLCKVNLDAQGGEGSILVPRVMVNAFVKSLSKDVKTVSIDCYHDDNYAELVAGNLFCATACLAGQFPSFESAFPKQINIVSEMAWTIDTDVALATVGKDRIIHARAVGSLQDVHYNGKLLKKVLKHSDGRFSIETLERPALTQTADGKIHFLIVPARR